MYGNGVKSTVDPCSKLIRVKSRLDPFDFDLTPLIFFMKGTAMADFLKSSKKNMVRKEKGSFTVSAGTNQNYINT